MNRCGLSTTGIIRLFFACLCACMIWHGNRYARRNSTIVQIAWIFPQRCAGFWCSRPSLFPFLAAVERIHRGEVYA
ncbi:hypothetical protein BX600DRAFT_457604 [Xylariales sp. PMI_506]|nr:hypothetical protein BX600DRAFT_457604 [Xylariales sp. PMI_506]